MRIQFFYILQFFSILNNPNMPFLISRTNAPQVPKWDILYKLIYILLINFNNLENLSIGALQKIHSISQCVLRSRIKEIVVAVGLFPPPKLYYNTIL